MEFNSKSSYAYSRTEQNIKYITSSTCQKIYHRWLRITRLATKQEIPNIKQMKS